MAKAEAFFIPTLFYKSDGDIAIASARRSHYLLLHHTFKIQPNLVCELLT